MAHGNHPAEQQENRRLRLSSDKLSVGGPPSGIRGSSTVRSHHRHTASGHAFFYVSPAKGSAHSTLLPHLPHRNPSIISPSVSFSSKPKTPPDTQAAQEGGQWILRVEDVSHGVGDEEVGSAGRPRGLCSSMSVASEVEAEAAAAPTDEELQAFLPLPTETVKLERA